MMAARKQPQTSPYAFIVVLTDADTGRKVCVSGMWLTRVEDSERGTVIHLLNGDLVRVEESFMAVARAFASGSL
jgi:hypothetical protein